MKLVAVDNQAAVATKVGVDFNLVDKWIAFAQVKKASEKTYRKGAKRLQEYFVANNITVPTRQDLIAYRAYLGEKYAGATANLYLTSARTFLQFLAAEGLIPDITQRVKGFKLDNEHKKAAFTNQQAAKITKTFDSSTVQGLRDKAMYAVMITAGLRTIEVARANIEDVTFEGGAIFLHVQGKGRDDKTAKVKLSAGVYELIRKYLAARAQEKRADVSKSAPLFASCSRRNKGGRLTTTSISRIMKQHFKAAGADCDSPLLTAHSLRHTAATNALKGNSSLREVQQMLRHKSIVVTERYLHDLERMKNNAELVAAAAVGF